MNLWPSVEYAICFAFFAGGIWVGYKLVLGGCVKILVAIGCAIGALSWLLNVQLDYWDFVQFIFLFPLPVIAGGLIGGLFGGIQQQP